MKNTEDITPKKGNFFKRKWRYIKIYRKTIFWYLKLIGILFLEILIIVISRNFSLLNLDKEMFYWLFAAT
ncbi:MAG: hypothetical protein KJ939_07930, partial [Nanoarchaeota archaeon]|nr:hypothetical protein [Nanoarchaeota archaeon]